MKWTAKLCTRFNPHFASRNLALPLIAHSYSHPLSLSLSGSFHFPLSLRLRWEKRCSGNTMRWPRPPIRSQWVKPLDTHIFSTWPPNGSHSKSERESIPLPARLFGPFADFLHLLFCHLCVISENVGDIMALDASWAGGRTLKCPPGYLLR